MIGTKFRSVSMIATGLAVAIMVAGPADARRGGSFGSRGSRTAVAPPATATAPKQAAPVQRTMNEKAPAQNPAAAARTPANAPGKMGGMAKGLIGGLIAGGLIGMLLGNGFGDLSGSGMLGALLQIALIGGAIWLALKLFRRRPALAPAGMGGLAPAGAGAGISPFTSPFSGGAQNTPQGGFATAARPAPVASPVSEDLAIAMSDKQAFERLLTEVQDAFGREDYAALRAITTPEIMSYLAEELSQNATRGLRNEVSGTELLNAEVAEAWSEDGEDYATIAMEYRSVDVMRDRNTGAVVEGDPTTPTHATEIWTFVRDHSNPWRLSAIQTA